MMHAHAVELSALAWFGGWLLAVSTLFALGLGLPLASTAPPWRRRIARAATLCAGFAIAVLANVAVTLHDTQFDLTRERLHTPAPAALAVVARLREPVRITYYLRGDDPDARRARDMLVELARHNDRLVLRSVDPDREPTLATMQGIKHYNVAVIEAAGRQVIVKGTDEAEIAVGIERVLRERLVTVCFAEGHGEYASENYEFHTHLEGAVGHDHGDPAAAVVDTTAHGYGRLRRSLESLGYVVQVVSLARPGGVPADCGMLIEAGPRTTHLPAESEALRRYLAGGGSALLMFDTGFEPEAGLRRLLADIGISLPPAIVTDPQNHYGTDAESVAVASYPPHPVTRHVSYTFFPGVRPLDLTPREQGADAPQALAESSTQALRTALAPAGERVPEASAQAPGPAGDAGRQVLAAAWEGALDGGRRARVVVIGDADFASNSYYPFVANSDLALAVARWLLREDARPALASRIPTPPVLVLTERQMRWVFLLLEIALPGAIALVGLGLWWRRR